MWLLEVVSSPKSTRITHLTLTKLACLAPFCSIVHKPSHRPSASGPFKQGDGSLVVPSWDASLAGAAVAAVVGGCGGRC